MKPLSNKSCIWTLSSCNSTGAILCGVIELVDAPGCNSITKCTSLCGGNLGSSFGKTCTHKPPEVDSNPVSPGVVHCLGSSIMLVPLEHNTTTIPCVGSNPPTITVNDDPMCRQPIHANNDIKLRHVHNPKVHRE